MSDTELIEVVTDFRAGMLGDGPSTNRCAMVSYALEGYLSMCGVECRVEMPPQGHVYLRLADGRVLDATGDQFNADLAYAGLSEPMPPVYLGPDLAVHNPAV